MLCDYGCGNESKFVMSSGKNCCSARYNSCPALRKKNSNSIKQAHKDGRIPGWNDHPQEVCNRSHAKGILKENDNTFTYNGKGNHKGLLIRERGHVCESCKNTEWLDSPIPLELEHTDGDNNNNTKENLKLLCCNCHALTPTWRRRKSTVSNNCKHTDATMKDAILSSYNMYEALRLLELKWGSHSTLKRVMKEYSISFKPKEIKTRMPYGDIKNSQYNTCWVCNIDLKCNKKIENNELAEYLINGWVKGRVMLFK